ncbi:MAG: hypothetical protein ACI4VM_07100 [Anaerovoracaceae bacterium]
MRKASDSFDWGGTSGPADRKKKKDISIDWNAGKIFDRSSGQVYSQASNSWSEPEDVKDLFTFDEKNEEFQEVLDRQVESIAESVPDYVPSSGRMFDLPSTMDMGLFDSLINDDVDVSLVDKDGGEHTVAELRGIKVPEAEKPEKPDIIKVTADHGDDDDTAAAGETARVASETGGPVGEDPDRPILPDENVQVVYETPDSIRRSSYTKEEEDRVFDGLRKLMDAEEKFKDDLERVSFLTQEELEQAEKIEQKKQKLTFVPTVAFRSLEDEYADYCDENGIEKPEPLKVSEDRKPRQPEEKTEKNESSHVISEAAGFLNRYRNRSADRDKKAVEIKINEPSGTRVTVKTQEFHIAGEEDGRDTQTREVNMEEVVNAPKNVQVSVEVSAAQGNASVEVTRRHDGATVVKTVDHANQEHMYVDSEEQEIKETAEVPEEPLNEEETDAETGAEAEAEGDGGSFWERADQATRMTITDIFGPEARKILDQIDRKREEEDAAVRKDMEDSLILDINPDDIRLTPDQTMALHTVSFEAVPGYQLKEEIEAEDIPAAEETAEIPDIEGIEEIEGTEETEDTGEAEGPSGQPELTEARGPEETEAVEDFDEQTEAEVHEGTAISGETETAEEDIPPVVETPPQAVAPVKTEEDLIEEHAAEQEIPEKEAAAAAAETAEEQGLQHRDKVQSKADKALAKEAERQKKRAEKAQKKLLKENETEKKSMSPVIKGLIVILALALIAEFSVFGIKLFASGSQAAVFIDKIEESVVGLFQGNGNSDEHLPADAGGTPEASGTGDTGDTGDTGNSGSTGEQPAQGA